MADQSYVILKPAALEGILASSNIVLEARPPDSQPPRFEDDQATLKRDIFQGRERGRNLPGKFAGSCHRGKLDHDKEVRH